MSANITVQDIFLRHYEEFCQQYSPSIAQAKAASHIMACRREPMGYHLDCCESCHDTKLIFHSCRDRSCNLCQTANKEEWVYNQEQYLLNIPYFHVVFTVPAELNSIIYANQRTMYSILFQTMSETILELTSDSKYLHATPGFTAVLHTWGQNLSFHPHLHVIVSSGGVDAHHKWHKSKDKFFLPVKVLSRVFRGKLLDAIQSQIDMSNPDNQHIINCCYQKDFVVYTKEPFRDASHVMRYLGRYTHRVAISNARIRSLSNGMVTFSYKDYADNNRWKEMTISAVEFIRRYLLHVLPKSFMKIRHYGYLSNRNKKAKVVLCKSLTNTPILPHLKKSKLDLLSLIMHRDLTFCPSCGMKRHPMRE